MVFRGVRTVILLVSVLLLAACGSGGNAEDNGEKATAPSTGDIQVEDAWIRPTVLPAGSPTPDPDHEHHDEQDENDDHSERGSGVISALYFTIENRGSSEEELVMVETDVARVTEIHETRSENGLMRMRPVEGVSLPAGDTVAFEPGGFHIMLIDITEQLEPGDTVAVTLVFGSGDRLELPAVSVQDS